MLRSETMVKGLGVLSAEDHQIESLSCIGEVVWNAYTVPPPVEPRSSPFHFTEMNAELHDRSPVTIVNSKQRKRKKEKKSDKKTY